MPLTMREHEEATGARLYRLMFRLLADYRKFGGSLRPEMVRYPGQLSLLLEGLDTVTADCRELLRRKLEEGGHDREMPSGVALAGGDAVACGHGRAVASATG